MQTWQPCIGYYSVKALPLHLTRRHMDPI